MLKILIILSIYFGIFAYPVLAQTPIDNLEKIRELKEKVASKVSELRQKKKQHISGEVKSAKDGIILLITPDGEKSVQVEKTTKYYWIKTNGEKLNLTFTNVEQGDAISIIGEGIDTDSITARTVIGKIKTFAISGNVSTWSKVNKQFTLKLENSEIKIMATAATVLLLGKDNKIVKGNLNDILDGAEVLVRGYNQDEINSSVTALRIIIISSQKLPQ